jgi:hypothetical protein
MELPAWAIVLLLALFWLVGSCVVAIFLGPILRDRQP